MRRVYIAALGGWDDTRAVLVKGEKKGVGGAGGRVSSWNLYLLDIAKKELITKIPFRYMTDEMDEFAAPDMNLANEAEKTVEPPAPTETAAADGAAAAKEGEQDLKSGDAAGKPDIKPGANPASPVEAGASSPAKRFL